MQLLHKVSAIAAALLITTTAYAGEMDYGIDFSGAGGDTLSLGINVSYSLESFFLDNIQVAGGGLYVKDIGSIDEKYKGFYLNASLQGEFASTLSWQLDYTYIGGTLDKLDKGYYKNIGTFSVDYSGLDVIDVVVGGNTQQSYFISLSKDIFANANLFAGISHNIDTEDTRGFIGVSISLQPQTSHASAINAANAITNLNNKIEDDMLKNKKGYYYGYY